MWQLFLVAYCLSRTLQEREREKESCYLTRQYNPPKSTLRWHPGKRNRGPHLWSLISTREPQRVGERAWLHSNSYPCDNWGNEAGPTLLVARGGGLRHGSNSCRRGFFYCFNISNMISFFLFFFSFG